MTTLIILVFGIFKLMIVVRVIISWIPIDQGNPIVEWLINWTEPVLEPVRRILGGDRLPIDLSPLIVLLVLQLVEQGIMRVVL